MSASPVEKSKLPSFILKFGAKSKLRGREVRVWKKRDSASAPWYIGPEWRGERYRACLNTAHRATAELKAEELCELIWNDRIAEFRAKLRTGQKSSVLSAQCSVVATIGEVIGAYEVQGPLYCRGLDTVSSYVRALRVVVREGRGFPLLTNAEVDGLSCEVLTGGLVNRFEAGRLKPVARTDEDKHQSTLETVNHYVRSARSMFRGKWLRIYTRSAEQGGCGLVLPSLDEFMSEEIQQPARKLKEPAAPELVARTFAASADLAVSDPPAYIAFLLGLCSMRRSEIGRMKRSWLHEVLADGHKSGWLVKVPKQSKSKVIRLLAVPPQVAAALVPRISSGAEDFVLPLPEGSSDAAKSRGDGIMRRLDKWFRALGWTTRHTLHELRAYLLHETGEEHGMAAAATVGGHGNEQVTRTSYVGLLERRALKLVVDVPLPLPKAETLKTEMLK
jgi:integrase